jgi:hypothetical protein
MCRFASFCTQEMDSTPPATKMSPHQHILDLTWIKFGAFNRMLDDVTTDRRAVGHVERSAPGFGETGACSRNNHCFVHDITPGK